MQFLPIIERELRVAARQSRTWWRRVLVMGAAVLLFALQYWEVSRWNIPSMIGYRTFVMLSLFAALYALLAGPLTTTDCLSRERREGTLGLLFLTDLRSYDVVLGKVCAVSLDLLLWLLGAFPLVAVPLMLGGVTLTQVGSVALTLLNLMFLSLAVGTCASALLNSGRASLGLAFGFLAFLTLGLPFLGEEVFHISLSGSRAAGFFYMFCPTTAMISSLRTMPPSPFRWYWLNMAGLHALGWLCLLVACRRTARAWHEGAEPASGPRWLERVRRWSRGGARWRRGWRDRMLHLNPVAWLEGREPLQERALWLLFFASTGFWLVNHFQSPARWPDMDLVILWPMFAHYLLCLWVAIQAPRRLADDKQSGALELLLCTPLPAAQIVEGSMRILRRRFVWLMFALMAFDVYALFEYLSLHCQGRLWVKDDIFQLAVCGALVIPVQVYSLARVGLYQGLADSHSLRATFKVVWKVGLLPWVVFAMFIVGCELWRQYVFRFPVSDELAFGAWTGAHLLVCGGFLAHANGQLRCHFRALAAQTVPEPWWRRWLHAIAPWQHKWS